MMTNTEEIKKAIALLLKNGYKIEPIELVQDNKYESQKNFR